MTTLVDAYANRGVPFTMVPNSILRGESGLSDRAITILCEIMSHRDGFNLRQRDLEREGRGSAAVRSAIEELTEAGYIIRTQKRSEGGKFGRNVWVRSWTPIDEGERDTILDSDGYYAPDWRKEPEPEEVEEPEQIEPVDEPEPDDDPFALTPEEMEAVKAGKVSTNVASVDPSEAGPPPTDDLPPPLPVKHPQTGEEISWEACMKLDADQMIRSMIDAAELPMGLGGEVDVWRECLRVIKKPDLAREYIADKILDLARADEEGRKKLTSRSVPRAIKQDAREWLERRESESSERAKKGKHKRGYVDVDTVRHQPAVKKFLQGGK